MCRVIKHNVSDEEYNAYTSAYDQYRRKVTANRIPLHASTLLEIVMDWSRGAISKYAMHFDTSLLHMVKSERYMDLLPELAKALILSGWTCALSPFCVQ
jgi:hypothetical protein